MKKGLIGIQMSTIKDKIAELGAYGTLKACAELGYHCGSISGSDDRRKRSRNEKSMRRIRN